MVGILEKGSPAEYIIETRSGNSSGVEHRLPKPRVAGSNPVFRSSYFFSSFPLQRFRAFRGIPREGVAVCGTCREALREIGLQFPPDSGKIMVSSTKSGVCPTLCHLWSLFQGGL